MATLAASLKSVRKYKIPRPFLKWVGGKGQLLLELRKSYPSKFGYYHEPFVGGGAVFFDLKPERAIISDANKELIDCYQVVKSNLGALVKSLKRHVYEHDYYYEVREQDPDNLDPVSRAARTIYLNKAGFNGLYRVNSKGKFNVPFGRHANPKICDEENLRGCRIVLRNAELKCSSFNKVLDVAEKGDFVYFDPPYIPVSDTAHFTAYQRNGFGMANQEELAEVFYALAAKGVYVILSNSDVPWMHERYRDYHIRSIQAKRSINSKASGRGPVGEVIVTSF
ncbi:MAG: DNA adenine methylase [Deltaproteobacteria bacterium]|nr:DNA adenine methylase [Deltaproteobacteria bacterium]